MVLVKRGCGPGNQTMKTISLSIPVSTMADVAFGVNELIERFGAQYVNFVQGTQLIVWTVKFADDWDCAAFLDEFEGNKYGREIK